MTNDASAALIERFRRNTAGYPRWLGVEPVSAGGGRAVMHLPARPELTNAAVARGVTHGGAVSGLIDLVCGMATLSVAAGPGFTGMTTTDLHVSFIGSPSGDLIASAEVLRAGNRTVFVQARVENGDGELCAMGLATYTLRGAREEPPLPGTPEEGANTA